MWYNDKFINYITGRKEEQKVGAVITSEAWDDLSRIMSTNSRFKFDGKNIWDYLHEKGIRIDSHVPNGQIGMTFNITFEGKEMATIETSSANGEKSIITTNHTYNVTTSDEYLDLAFLTAFAIAKTEQVYYN